MSTKRRAYRLLALPALIVVALLLPGLAAGLRPAQAEPGVTYQVALPLIFKNHPDALYGRVMQGGVPAAGVPLSLHFYNGAAWSIRATTTTDSGGRYYFMNVPALSAGQRYMVRYDNTTGTEGRLAWWQTRELTVYNGHRLEFANFDIADVPLNYPGHGALYCLPVGFQWTRRAASPNDTYAVRLYDASDLSPAWTSAYQGYVNGYTLSSLPSGFGWGQTYTWDVLVRSPDGGVGASRQARTVNLTAGLYGRVTVNGAAAGGVTLQLRYFDGKAWSTHATTTTNGEGVYMFTNVPTLGAGQQYYVRYQNVAQTEGRLYQWSTRALTSYAAGSGVDMGSFDIADIPLNSPAGGAQVGLPATFEWGRRPATTSDSYLLHVYDPADYSPHWCGPLVGYTGHYTLGGLPAGLSLNTQYAWEVVVYSPDGGSGISRMARLIRFTSSALAPSDAAVESSPWPFPEDPLPRPPETFDGGS